MLILSRKVDEIIIINDEITMTIIDIRGDRVRIGFDAPSHIEIHRQEFWMKLNEVKQALPHTEG